MSTELYGMPVSVLRIADRGGVDCTNGGVSGRVNQFVLVGPDIWPLFAATEERPALRIIRRFINGTEYVHAEPLATAEQQHYMFGGNYVTSCDSRVQSINRYPIPVHDRIEN